MTRIPATALSIALITAAVAACGGSSSKSTTSQPSSTPAATSTPTTTSSSTATGSQTLALAANPGGALKFDKASLTAKAGTVTIAFTNSSPLGHNVTIQKGTNGPVVGATPTFMGGTKTLTVKLTAGTYTYYCSVPGHRQAGMQGTLTVQ